MDNRWYAIIIILIVGLSAMYFVVSSSNTVGSAVIIVNDVSVTLPDSFKILHNQPDESELQSRSGNETIFIKYLCDGNNSLKEYEKELKSLNNSDIEVLENSTHGTVHKIMCKNTTKYSLYYFEKSDRTLMIKSTHFNNDSDENSTVNYVIDSIRSDFKQKRS